MFGKRAGMFRKTKEISVYDRSIKVSQYPGPTSWRSHGKPVGKLGSRFETSDGMAQGDMDFPMGRRTHPNKPNRFKFWWVNQIDGFPAQANPSRLSCMLSTGYSEIRAGS
jgi:hypothetical protein